MSGIIIKLNPLEKEPLNLSLDELREQMIIALFSDDELMDRLVLKGGNALALIHKVGERATIDLDFSIEDSFPDEFNPEERIRSALQRHFSVMGLRVFDVKFKEKPGSPDDSVPVWWGGYIVEFKIISSEKYQQIQDAAVSKGKDPLEDARRQAINLSGGGPNQKITYKIDISKHEYCREKEPKELDDITVYVYSLEMIVIEKLRAICQQMEGYSHVSSARSRGRDFYDIHAVLTHSETDLASRRELFQAIFKSKDVPLEWLWKIPDQKEFHRVGWEGVKDSTKDAKDYDYYFDYVCDLLKNLKATWNV